MEQVRRFFSEWFRNRKIKKFEREYDKFFTALLLGELYNQKVKLLTEMKRNKEQWLKKYLDNGQSVYSQINQYLDAD